MFIYDHIFLILKLGKSTRTTIHVLFVPQFMHEWTLPPTLTTWASCFVPRGSTKCMQWWAPPTDHASHPSILFFFPVHARQNGMPLARAILTLECNYHISSFLFP